MMKKIMEYNGYRAMIEYDEDDELFVGTVIGINDSISFHGQNIQELKQHFKDNIDNYVDMCRQFGKQPERYQSCLFEVPADPFYSDSNIRYLENIVRDIKDGKAHFAEHDLIEAD